MYTCICPDGQRALMNLARRNRCLHYPIDAYNRSPHRLCTPTVKLHRTSGLCGIVEPADVRSDVLCNEQRDASVSENRKGGRLQMTRSVVWGFRKTVHPDRRYESPSGMMSDVLGPGYTASRRTCCQLNGEIVRCT